MDIGVANQLSSELKATIEVAEFRKEMAVSPGAVWVSKNVIKSGSTPTVTLTTGDERRKAVTWSPEDENENYLLFKITPENITYRMSNKGAVNRTQVTESPDSN